jgi:hypothetical protein
MLVTLSSLRLPRTRLVRSRRHRRRGCVPFLVDQVRLAPSPGTTRPSRIATGGVVPGLSVWLGRPLWAGGQPVIDVGRHQFFS